MKLSKALKTTASAKGDFYRKVKSAGVCNAYEEISHQKFPELSFGKAISLKGTVLKVMVPSHTHAMTVKLYEYDLIQAINSRVSDENFQISKIYCEIGNI
jgi:hypothetical protein